ncbi:MAG: hypothetical protein CL793_07585 [Chloroflexi bacterium]|nr:hypothetical protein [Chloroflexota bacterium]|tara:strand:- start:4628 stop:4924 length:297 start_codon:yes stop_codon:yes gene_type:complete
MKNKKEHARNWTDSAKVLQSRKCLSCEAPWATTIRECLEAMAEDNRPQVTFAAMHRWLTDPKNFEGDPYPLSLTGLLYHVREHETELYRRVVNRGAEE